MLTADKAKTKKAATKKQSTTVKSIKKVIPEQRQRMINEAAYYLAESRGFLGADSMDDWLAAEAEVDKQLSQGTR